LAFANSRVKLAQDLDGSDVTIGCGGKNRRRAIFYFLLVRKLYRKEKRTILGYIHVIAQLDEGPDALAVSVVRGGIERCPSVCPGKTSDPTTTVQKKQTIGHNVQASPDTDKQADRGRVPVERSSKQRRCPVLARSIHIHATAQQQLLDARNMPP